jgi:hypothetical protein
MSVFSLSRWRPYHLLISWCAYWLALLIVAVGPAVPAILRATGAPGNHGEINVSFGDGGFSLTVKELGQVTWHGVIGFLPAVLWMGLPPLALWLLWLRARGDALRADTRSSVSASAR